MRLYGQQLIETQALQVGHAAELSQGTCQWPSAEDCPSKGQSLQVLQACNCPHQLHVMVVIHIQVITLGWQEAATQGERVQALAADECLQYAYGPIWVTA